MHNLFYLRNTFATQLTIESADKFNVVYKKLIQEKDAGSNG